MIKILSDTLHHATLITPNQSRAHWKPSERFDNRHDAALEAHRLGQGHL
ncbi:MAG: hypothetical protein AAGF53_14345 [Pseudomonadota bacterium]